MKLSSLNFCSYSVLFKLSQTKLQLKLSYAENTVSIASKPLNKKVTDSDDGRALGFGLYMMDSNGNGDEARYNLATRIMSNGVEVIVAGDKSTLPGEPNVLRILPSSHYKQTTMPASTLKGDHMVMLLPDDLEIDELSSSLYDLNKFVTRTCLTTYTYLTTYLQDGTTTVESREKVISNTATEERNLLKISPTPTAGLTFSQTPKLAIGTFPTTYTYLNTIFDGDQPIVLTSKHTVTNTITAPDDYLSLLQPSESMTAIHDTNTYYSTVALTKTIHDNDQSKVISTDTIFTQIVITESLPSKMTSVMTSYVAFDVDDPHSNDLNEFATTDVLKTYYVTYTYLNTLIDNGSLIVRTNVSTSSDIVTEKLYLYSKRTEAVESTTPPQVIDTKPSKAFDSINIYATKTYLTTFTYFTTLLQVNSNNQHASSTVIDSHTSVVENVITESIPHSLFPTQSLSSYYSAVQTAKNPNGIVTIATLLEGQTLEVTAIAPTETSIKISSTTLTNFVDKDIEQNDDDNTISDDVSIEGQSSDVVNSYGQQQEQNKIEKIDNQVNDLIGSFNLNSLTAFGPVFNALTGLIQNNFVKNSNENNVTIVKNSRNGTVIIQDGNDQNVVPAAISDITGRNPIYIPVGGIAEEGIESSESQNIDVSQLNSFVAPVPPPVKWTNDNGDQSQQLVIGKPTRESPLLNGGIPISPGDVITANSDVIIGRPTGISPRIPLNSDDQLDLHPPPIQSFPHYVNNNVRDSIPLQSIKTESYIGPPPPPMQQKHRINGNKNQIHDAHRPPVIPFNSVYNDRGTVIPHPTSHQEIRLNNAKKTLANNFLLPPPFLSKPQLNFHQEHQSHQFTQRPVSLSIPLIQSNDHHGIQIQQPKQHSQIRNHQHHPQQVAIVPPTLPSSSPPNIPKDSFFEIQQIPEVFSTDLPPIHVLEYPQYPIEPSLPVLPQASVFSPLPDIIEQSTGQSLLVNIQPSQIANIIIPHGSTTALIYGGANELHKNGQYFNEPSPYIDADINLFYTSKTNTSGINQNVINVDIPHNHQQGHVNIQPHKPILANHEINMNANVLSQDVDLHAPPIKFNFKEENDIQPQIVQSNKNFDYERENGYVEHGGNEGDNAVSSSKHRHNEHAPIVPQTSTSAVTSDLPDLFHQQSNYVVPYTNNHDKQQAYNIHNHNNNHNQVNGHFYYNHQKQFLNNEYSIQNNTQPLNNVHNGKHYHPKNPPNIIEYNGPPPQLPSRHRQRPNFAVPNDPITKSQQPQFYQHYYPQQHTMRPTAENVFLNTNPPHQSHSNRPQPGKIVSYVSATQMHPPQQQQPIYINLHEHIDDAGTHAHSNAPSVTDIIVDEHKDDDIENEEGEVIQESNSVPVVPGQKPKDVFDVEQSTASPKTTVFISTTHEQQHNLSLVNEIINTQTESNDLWKLAESTNANSGLNENRKPIRAYPTAPPAVLINQLRPEHLYPPTAPPKVNKHRLEYENNRRPIIPVRPLENPTFGQQSVIEPRPSLEPPPRQIVKPQQIGKPRPSLEPPTKSPSANPFIISKNTIGFNRNRLQVMPNGLQISMPINTIGSDNSANLGQTEEPFNPQYTSIAKGNPFVVSRLTTSSTKQSSVEVTSPISTTSSISTTTPLPSSTSSRPSTTTRKSIQTTRFSTQTTKQNAISKLEIKLNTGEVTTKKYVDNYGPSDEKEPSGGIFHFQESVHPHNFGVVKEDDAQPNQIKNKHHNFGVYEDTIKHQHENIKLDYPEPSVDMMPPPPNNYNEKSPVSTEEVMGLNPPPLPTVFGDTEVITQRPAVIVKTTTLPSPDTHFPNTTSQYGFRQTNRPYRYETIFRTPSETETTTTRSRTRTRGTTQPYQPITRSTSKPIPLSAESESNSDLSIQKPPRIYENHKHNDIQPTPSFATTDNAVPSVQMIDSITNESQQRKQTNISRQESHNRQYTHLNTRYRLPSDILILGTEQTIHNDRTSTSATTSLPTRRTQLLPQKQLETISTTPINNEPTTIINSKETTIASEIDSSTDYNGPSTRYRTKSPPILLPTKYITNTKTLTVTTTKTTVIRSQGITTTLTLTLTKTSTILDTITHEVTHTLVQPTIVTTPSFIADDKIVATSTVQEVPVYSNYPSFPVLATASYGDDESESHPTFLEDEANLDEFIINYDDEIQVKKSSNPNQGNQNITIQNVSIPHGENESIFVIMTDQKQPSIININPSMIDKPHRINAMSGDDDKLNEIGSDNGDSNVGDAVNRDEDDMTKDVNHVLLGGILIASPPRLDAPKMFTVNECRPDCKASRNELCQKSDGQMRCVCRPGFARMFPDRPCKPTYTFTLNLPLVQHGTEKLRFEEALTKKTSPKYTHLSGIVHDGLDRMVMQSDLRDIYHGVHVIGFKNSSSSFSSDDQQGETSGVTSIFYLQLSDNYDDMRLVDIFRRYLRNNNYSLGGTDLYSSRALVDDMTATDFDECINTKFNDCSEESHCFNLRGTYTCSCKEGFADLSGNPIYPGRICSAELIGCEKCNYHGTCYSRGDDQMLCECFQWYAGNNCHVNLKVMLIALITIGLILFLLLLICLIMTCCKRKQPNNRTLVGMGLVANKLVANQQRTMDRRAMIQETSSEASEDTHTLPYVANKQNQLNKSRNSNSNLSLNNKFTTVATQNSSVGAGHSTLGMEQKDRSLTVMIPRAKYHPAAPPPPPIVVATTRYNMDSGASVCSTTEAKLLSYLDASPSATTDHPRKKSGTNPLNKHGALNTTSTGALISAGFEVSATVGTENDLFEKLWLYNKLKSENEQHTSAFQQHQLQEKSIKIDDVDGHHTDGKAEVASTITHGNDDKSLLSPMGEWMDIDTHNEMTMSEARSYYETTIQPSTKTFRHPASSNKAPSRNNEEANTMAERDLGSTFLLPHTHLYKPDRGSDISGFDSL